MPEIEDALFGHFESWFSMAHWPWSAGTFMRTNDARGCAHTEGNAAGATSKAEYTL